MRNLEATYGMTIQVEGGRIKTHVYWMIWNDYDG
jgi:hypothetical protein